MRRSLAFTLIPLAALLPTRGAADPPPDYVARMVEEHAGDRPLPSPAAAEPAAAVEAEAVAYAEIGDVTIHGYLARPQGGDPLAGIVLIHEWWGLNDNIRAVARRLAGEGYAALAVDLYEGEVGEDRETAARLAQASISRQERLEENLRQAYDYLEQQGGVERIGVVGWCFGGGWSLRAALLQPERTDAAVIYYGRLVTDRGQLERLQTPILGIFGALDDGIPVSSVRQFEEILLELGKQPTIHVYEDADHAFANPSGTAYNAEAAADAWEKTLAFFQKHLG